MRDIAVERDDRRLLAEVSRGNDSAFWSLWQCYTPHLYGVCLRHLRGVPADAADAVSRSMLVARARLPQCAAQIENIEAWLTRLTCNVCIDIHRERRRDICAGAIDDGADGDVDASAFHCPLTPEDEALRREAVHRIAEAIRALPQRLRVVAELRFLEDVDYDAIARRLNITQQSARKRVQQARAILSDALGHAVTLRDGRTASPPLMASRPTPPSRDAQVRER